MKKYLSLTILAAVILPVAVNAQLTITDIASTNAPTTNIFHTLIQQMTADNWALVTPEGGALTGQNTIYWDWNGTSPTVGSWEGSSFIPGLFDIRFEVYSPNNILDLNPGSFGVAANTVVNVGYMGGEHGDINQLWVKAGNDLATANAAAVQPVFTYKVPDAAPYSRELSYNTPNQAYTVIFGHSDISQSGPTSQQGIEAKFRIYQAWVGNTPYQTYLIGIDDREEELVDYDDGFFLVQFGDAPIVPEPSAIAALSILGLGGLLVVRRRMLKTRR